MANRSTAFIALGSVIIFLILYFLTNAGFFGENVIGEAGIGTGPLIVPAGYAFSIWGVIYLGLIAFPIYQLFVKKERHILWDKIRIAFSINLIANGLWLVVASYNWLWISVGVMLVLLILLILIKEWLVSIQKDGGEVNFLAESFVFSAYYAWITIAAALNISAALKFYNWNGFGIDEVSWTLIILTVAAAIAAWVFLKYRDNVYAGVVIWAFVAIVVRHIQANPSIAYLAIGVNIVFLALIINKERLTANG